MRSARFSFLLMAGWLLLLAPAVAQHWVTEPVSAPGVEFHVFDSAAVGGPVSFHVYLPPQYAVEPERRFPAVYWLHGALGVLTGIEPMSQRFGLAMAHGHLPPLIVVFPNGLPLGMWADAVSGLQPVESMLVDDLFAHVDASFRTIPTPAGRMLDGFSMGGYGAARLGLRYRDLFAGFSMIGSGPLQLDFLGDNPDYLIPLELRQLILERVFDNNLAIFVAESPLTLASVHAADLPPEYPIRQIVGMEDPVLNTNRAFRDHLSDLGIEQQYLELPGVGHNMVQVMNAMGPEFWRFHRETLAGAERVFADGFEAVETADAVLLRSPLSTSRPEPQSGPGGVRPGRP